MRGGVSAMRVPAMRVAPSAEFLPRLLAQPGKRASFRISPAGRVNPGFFFFCKFGWFWQYKWSAGIGLRLPSSGRDQRRSSQRSTFEFRTGISSRASFFRADSNRWISVLRLR